LARHELRDERQADKRGRERPPAPRRHRGHAREEQPEPKHKLAEVIRVSARFVQSRVAPRMGVVGRQKRVAGRAQLLFVNALLVVGDGL
jgi:hypothetical protein